MEPIVLSHLTNAWGCIFTCTDRNLPLASFGHASYIRVFGKLRDVERSRSTYKEMWLGIEVLQMEALRIFFHIKVIANARHFCREPSKPSARYCFESFCLNVSDLLRMGYWMMRAQSHYCVRATSTLAKSKVPTMPSYSWLCSLWCLLHVCAEIAL